MVPIVVLCKPIGYNSRQYLNIQTVPQPLTSEALEAGARMIDKIRRASHQPHELGSVSTYLRILPAFVAVGLKASLEETS